MEHFSVVKSTTLSPARKPIGRLFIINNLKRNLLVTRPLIFSACIALLLLNASSECTDIYVVFYERSIIVSVVVRRL